MEPYKLPFSCTEPWSLFRQGLVDRPTDSDGFTYRISRRPHAVFGLPWCQANAAELRRMTMSI